ncbi:MAG: hypothetical protein Q7U25_09220 [Sulfuricella sp.]|nr:hypothetical protein [Sulfuricella sp.]
MIENISLKTRILLPLALVLAILLGAFHYNLYRHEKTDADYRFVGALQSAKAYYQRALTRRGEKLGGHPARRAIAGGAARQGSGCLAEAGGTAVQEIA